MICFLGSKTLFFCSRQNMHTTMWIACSSGYSGPDDPPLGPWQRRAACQRCSIALHCGMLACPLQHTDRDVHASGWFHGQVTRLPGPKPVVGSEESPLPARATKGPAGSVTSPPSCLQAHKSPASFAHFHPLCRPSGQSGVPDSLVELRREQALGTVWVMLGMVLHRAVIRS